MSLLLMLQASRKGKQPQRPVEKSPNSEVHPNCSTPRCLSHVNDQDTEEELFPSQRLPAVVTHTPLCKPSHKSIHEEHHPDPTSGSVYCWEHVKCQPSQLYNPMWRDKIIFEKGEWLGNVHVSDGDRDKYLQQDNPRIPWKSVHGFNHDIDQLPHGPDWHILHVQLPNGQMIEMHARNPVDVIRQLIGNQLHSKSIWYAPVRQWTSTARQKQIYSEIWTGNWWWRLQNVLGWGRGATIAPVILSTDKTQLSLMSGNKKAWPVYLTIGNISKSVRRRPSEHANILLGYIPVTGLSGEDEWQFYHDCLSTMLKPLEKAGEHGKEMLCADGGVRLVFPILAAFIGDFPKQCLATCSRQNRCPICKVPIHEHGNWGRRYEFRDKEDLLSALNNPKPGNTKILKNLGFRPTHPFWESLPYVQLSKSITPDLLHQLHKGVFGDHLVNWFTKLLGSKQFDRRLIGLPRAFGIRHFTRGKSVIKQWTGREAKSLVQVFMSVVAGYDEPKAVQAARHLLDFVYRVHLSQISDDDLEELNRDCASFHAVKDIFVQLGAVNSEEDFDRIPKLHMLGHYSHSICELGTTDNFNTEATERLHIEYVKDGWRASNHVNKIPQMTKYLQRREAWALLRTHLSDIGVLPPDDESTSPDCPPQCGEGPIHNEVTSLPSDGGTWEGIQPQNNICKEAKEGPEVANEWQANCIWYPKPLISTSCDRSNVKRTGAYLIKKHGAVSLIDATQDFLASRTGSHSLRPLHEHHKFLVWPRCKLEHGQIPLLPLDPAHTESIRATLQLADELGRLTRYAAFDTAFFVTNQANQGLHRKPDLNLFVG